MKRIRKILLFMLMLVMMFSVPVQAANVKMNKTKLTLNVNQSEKLTLKNAKGTVKWKSSNKKIATVNSTGKVTAKKVGTASITATYKGKKYVCKITVKAQDPNSEFIKVKNYIIKHGVVNSNDDIMISDTYYYAGMDVFYALIYEYEKNRIDMYVRGEDKRGKDSTGTFYCDVYLVPNMTSSTLKCEYMDINSTETKSSEAYAFINPRTVTVGNINFIVTNNDMYISNYAVNKIANSAFKIGFLLWEDLLKRCDSSFKNLGFTGIKY